MAYAVSAIVMTWSDEAAEASFAAKRACKRLGIAIAARMRMIATTRQSSIRENPRVCAMVHRPARGRVVGNIGEFGRYTNEIRKRLSAGNGK